VEQTGQGRVLRAPASSEFKMLKMTLVATVIFVLSSAAMAQDAKAPATTGPAAQSGDNMAKGDTSKATTSKKKMTKTTKKKTDSKM
jgi:hypothetical protein